MDTVLFTDNQVLVFAITASAISLVLTVLLVSTRVEKGVDRLESLKFAKSSCINKRWASGSISNQLALRQGNNAPSALAPLYPQRRTCAVH